MLATTILQHVDPERLQRGVEGLASGAYPITITGQSAEEIRGFVRNGDGVSYGVTLLTGRAFCNCPDSMFRHRLCKHSVALALHVIRNPQAAEPEEEEKPPVYNLKLGKVRKDFAFSA